MNCPSESREHLSSSSEVGLEKCRMPSLGFELYSAQLLLDPATTTLVQSCKEVLVARALVPRLDPCPPHISLSAAKDLNLGALRLDDLTERLPISLRLSSFGVFPEEGGFTVFLSLNRCDELSALHEEFHSRFEAAAKEVESHYLPANIVPHITLGCGISAENVGAVLQACAALGTLPLTARAVSISLFGMPGAELLDHLHTAAPPAN